jgi:hypothetical protein
MLERIAIVVQSLALALWMGAMAGFAFIFAPIAFRTIGNMTTFGLVTSGVLRSLSIFGGVCGTVAIVASMARSWSGENLRVRILSNALILIAFGATAYEQQSILPQMEASAAQIPGAIDSVPKEDPRRVAYDAQHSASTRVYGLAFLCVAAATALVAFGRTRKA